MKNLQEQTEQDWKLAAEFKLQVITRKPENARSIILLLHGLDERGLRIYRKLVKSLPEDSYILAPNAPFPLPRQKADRLDFGYTWYFYDKHQAIYHIDQTLALSLLGNLLKEANPEGLPVTVIGFSQGGYLAPLLGYQEKSIKHIIGIGCEFREHFFKTAPHFTLDAVHGLDDQIINPEHAQNEITKLEGKNIHVNWHPVMNLKHEINNEAGKVIQTILENYGKRSL